MVELPAVVFVGGGGHLRGGITRRGSIKITYLRDVPSGTVGDRDVYGAQQHAPLMDIDIP